MSYKDDFQQGMDRGIELFGGVGARFLFYVIAGGYVLSLANQAAVSPPVVLTAILTSIGPNLMSGLIDKFKDGKGFDKKQLKQLEETLNKAVEGHEEELLAFFEHNQDFLNKILKNQDWMVQIIDGGIDEIVGEISKSSVKIDEVLTIVSSTEAKVDALKEAVDLAVQMMLYGTHNKSKPKVLLDTRVGKNIVLFATFGTIGQAGNYQPGEDWANLISGNLYTLLRENDIRVIALSTEVSSIGEAYDLLDEYNAQAIIWGKISQSYIRFECTIDSRFDGMFPTDMSSFKHDTSGQMSYQAYIEQYTDIEVVLYTVAALINFFDGKFEETKTYLSEAISHCSPSRMTQLGISYIYNLRGDCLSFLGLPLDALKDYSNAIDLDAYLSNAYNNRANVYLDLGEYDKALLDFNEAIRLAPESAVNYCNRSKYFLQSSRYDNAFSDLNKAISLNPELAMSYVNRGNAYLGIFKYEDAITDYSKAIMLEPNLTLAYVNRGEVFFHLYRYEEALADVSKAIELFPNFPPLFYKRACIYSESNRENKAIEDLNLVISLNPKFADAYGLRGLLLSQKMHKYKDALGDLEKYRSLTRYRNPIIQSEIYRLRKILRR